MSVEEFSTNPDTSCIQEILNITGDFAAFT